MAGKAPVSSTHLTECMADTEQMDPACLLPPNPPQARRLILGFYKKYFRVL